jgi:hypothetical protein
MAGRKFYYHGRTVTDADTPVETLPPQAQLDLTVRFENLTDGELGVLLTALGLGETPLVLKVGGGKPVCYGSVVVLSQTLEVDASPEDRYASYDDAPPQAVAVDRYVQAADSLLDKAHLQKLAQIWQYDMDRYCPGGNY